MKKASLIWLIFLIVSIFLVLVFWIDIFSSYMSNHSYYVEMLLKNQSYDSGIQKFFVSLWTILWAILPALIIALIPVLYLVFSKKPKFWITWLLFALALMIFNYSFIQDKSEGVTQWGWIFILLSILFFSIIITFFVVGVTALGTLIKEKILWLLDRSIFDLLVNFSLGMSVYLLMYYILIATWLFYSPISWVVFLSLAAFIRFSRKSLAEYKVLLGSVLEVFQWSKLLQKPVLWIWLLLLLLTLAYIFYWYSLAYIPYPTAWDANHAYMFYPKMRSLNHWYYWDEANMRTTLDIWSIYIATWFSLFTPLQNVLWISPDTVAVVMNYLSAIFVLVIGLALVKQFLQNISHGRSDSHEDVVFYTGWFSLLLWLTSWMWAFLVFVDNKTDLGVLTYIAIALYSWFVFFHKLYEAQGVSFDKKLLKYLALSGFFFAIASIAKVTAMLDALNFWMYMAFMWIWSIAAIGWFIAVIWLLSAISFNWIKDYIPAWVGKALLSIGLGLWAIQTLWKLFKKQFVYIAYMGIWAWSFFVTLFLFKWTFTIYSKIAYNESLNPVNVIKSTLLWYSPENKEENFKNVLLAQTDAQSDATVETTQITPDQCSIELLSQSQKDNLYTTTKPVVWNAYDEDVWRYVWYGARTFDNPWWGGFFSVGCHSFDSSAEYLCENSAGLSSFSPSLIQKAYDNAPQDSKAKELLSNIVNQPLFQSLLTWWSEYWAAVVDQFNDDIKVITDYVSSSAIIVGQNATGKKQIAVPYKYLTVLNISFNWSLQNLSSYYTDIGYMWVIIQILLIIGLIYAIVKRSTIVLAISIIAIAAWLIWFFIWGWILWYGIWLVLWTILALCGFFYISYDKDNQTQQVLWYVLVAVFALFGLAQLCLNFVRISTQWWSGPFVRYKKHTGSDITYTSALKQNQSIVSPYTADYLFKLQFPHYQKLLDLANSRAEWDGIVVAWTYARYFINSQKFINYDQFLIDVWKNFSDNDICKSYLRLQDKHVKYLAIDPNIWTVVMGDGNATLFHRFFAKLSTDQNTIEDNWVMTMLIKLANAGYVKYISSNNLWAKYAFTLSDGEFQWYLSWANINSDMDLFRAKLAVARFWPNVQEYANLIINIFASRVANGNAIWDLADMQWKIIDESKLKGFIANAPLYEKIKTYMVQGIRNPNMNLTIPELENTTQDERAVLFYYVQLSLALQNDQNAFVNEVNRLIVQSIAGSSQIIILERK